MLSAMQDVQCLGAGAAWAVAALSVSEKAARAMVPATVRRETEITRGPHWPRGAAESKLGC